jgi:hypothetical protein
LISLDAIDFDLTRRDFDFDLARRDRFRSCSTPLISISLDAIDSISLDAIDSISLDAIDSISLDAIDFDLVRRD